MNKKVLKKLIITLSLIMVLSMFLSRQLYGSDIEFVFRLMWISLAFIVTLLRGAWVILEEQNKIVGYLYFIMAFIFISYILSLYVYF